MNIARFIFRHRECQHWIPRHCQILCHQKRSKSPHEISRGAMSNSTAGAHRALLSNSAHSYPQMPMNRSSTREQHDKLHIEVLMRSLLITRPCHLDSQSSSTQLDIWKRLSSSAIVESMYPNLEKRTLNWKSPGRQTVPTNNIWLRTNSAYEYWSPKWQGLSIKGGCLSSSANWTLNCSEQPPEA